MIRGFLFLALPFFTLNLFARTPSEISIDKSWLNLLHYRQGLFGTKSEITNQHFFLASDGAKKADLELEASIKAIFHDQYSGDPDAHPACRFPARKIYLEKELGLKRQVHCPRFERFKEKMEAKGVALIFSSYFLDTPASAFGHTFLRFLKNPDKEDQFELLDYSLNYAAAVTTSNALIYSIMGLAGGFDGEFTSLPHFYKVREYNDHESRDLWSYELNVTHAELETIIAHAWELGQVPIPYYYLTGNCSYYMLALLDAANPNWRLVERNPYFVLPVDTLKTVASVPGLIKNIQYRPSKRRVFEKQLEALSENEKEILHKVYNENSLTPIDEIKDVKEKAKLLDAFIDYWDYKNSKAITSENNEVLQQKNQFLIARSQIPVATKPPEIEMPFYENPILGHGSRRIKMGGGYHKDRRAFFDFEWRFALHDFYDSKTGQNPLATMEMGRFKFRYYSNKEKTAHQWRIQEAYLLNVASLSNFKDFFRAPSWRFKLGMRTLEDRSCNNCQVAHTSLGVGMSKSNDRHIFSMMAATEIDAGSGLVQKKWRIGLGPELFYRYQLKDSFSIGIEADYKWRFITTTPKGTWEITPKSRFYMNDGWSLEVWGAQNDSSKMAGTSILKTF